MVAAGLQPLEPYPGGKRQWLCRCTICGHEVTPTYGSVRAGQGGCVYCAGKRVDPADAVGVMVAAGLQPLEPYPGGKRQWLCRCTICGRKVTVRYGSVRSGNGCANCTRDLASEILRVAPDLALEVMRSAGLEPLEPYRNARTPWLCRCVTCGHEITPTYGSVRVRHGGCVWCARSRVDPADAVAFMRSAGLAPLEPYPGSMVPWRCLCMTCEREVTPLFSNTRSGKRCAYCSEKRVDPDDAVGVMRAAGLEPLEPYRSTNRPWLCRCMTCEREVTPTHGSVRAGQGGCVYCGVGGFDYTAPGIVYLMRHPDLFCLKVGVSTTAAKQVRVDTHAKTGWVTIGTWDTPTGETAEQIEQQILGWWRNELGAPPALTKTEMPTGGWSETAALIHVDIDDTINRINQLVAELEP